MNFHQLLTYWTMKDMVRERGYISNAKIVDSQRVHHVRSVKIAKTKHSFEYAEILYRCEEIGGTYFNYALVYADVLFGGTASPQKVLLKNASVAQLREHFIEHA